MPPGPGNSVLAPLFTSAAAGDFRLWPESPCINAGSNELVSGDTDLAGNPRISGGQADLGVYEFDLVAPLVFVSGFKLTAEDLRINWLASAIGSTLQRSVTLNPPAWQNVPGSEAVTSLTVLVTKATGFFRLVKR